jgi:hypothetical protein
MKITWESNKSPPATVIDSFVDNSTSDGLIHNVIYITLDKPVDPSVTVFYLNGAEGFINISPASILTQGFKIYSNISPATQQALEFKLGQRDVASQVKNAWSF